MSDMIEEQEVQQLPEPPKPEALPGRRLREAREAAGLSRGEIALQMHISEHKVAALEEDNYAALPTAIYVAGYLRSYARILGLPEDDFALAQNESEAEASLIPSVGRQDQASSLDLPVRMVTWLLVGVVIISITTWLVAQRKTDDAEPSAVAEMPAESAPVIAQPAPLEESAPSLPDETLAMDETPPMAAEQEGMTSSADVSTEAQAAVAPQAAEAEMAATTEVVEPVASVAETQMVETGEGSVMPAPADEPLAPPLTDETPQSKLMLTYQDDCWTEVDDSAGRHLVYGLMRAGQTLELKGEAPFNVFLGYAPGATVNYNGALFDHSPYQRGDIARFRVGRAEQNQPVSR